MAWSPTELDQRHHAILRLAFEGLAPSAIAGQVGMSKFAVRAILRSPLGQAELARLKERAEESLTNIPLKARLIQELNGAGHEALKVNRGLMNDPLIDPRVRAGIGKHFLDRIVFGELEEVREGGYREILRKLDHIQSEVDRGAERAIIIQPRPSGRLNGDVVAEGEAGA